MICDTLINYGVVCVINPFYRSKTPVEISDAAVILSSEYAVDG
jgi:hypothetical protein